MSTGSLRLGTVPLLRALNSLIATSTMIQLRQTKEGVASVGYSSSSFKNNQYEHKSDNDTGIINSEI